MRTAALTAAFAFFIATNAGAQANYTVTDLGYLPGGLDTTAVSVNNLGHVVGMASDANAKSVAFYYAGSLVPLGSLGGGFSKANGINDSDRIVGWATTAAGKAHAFVYDAASADPQMIDLHGLLGIGGVESRATAINNSGQIVGVATAPSGALHAFLITGNTAQDLHSQVNFGGLESAATGITDNGLVVGSATDANDHTFAFVYDLNTSTLTNLGSLGGNESAAQAVNGAGSVVGLSDTISGDPYAFQTSPGLTLASGLNLGALGGTGSSAFGINATGESVGQADDAAGGAHAFIYSATSGMRDLETLIPVDSGWILSYGAGINDSGAIVGVGVRNGTSASFLLTPAATPVTLATSPSGLAIVVDGISDTAPKTYQWVPTSDHQISTTEPQQLTAGSRLMFSSWSDGGAFTHAVTTPSNPTTYTATFKTQYLLTTATNPPAGGSITQGDWFDSGSSVTMTAAAAAGYGFTGFSGDLSGTTNPNIVAMDAARTVTANFKGLTTTNLGTSPNPSTFGQAVTMTATVTSLAGIPGGSVDFCDGATNIGTQPLDGSGSATLTVSLTGGSHTLSASYAGTGSFLASISAPLTQTVNKASTSTSVNSSRNPAVAGQTVTFTALVASAVAGRTGSVTFKDGGASLGTGALSPSGQATFSTSSLAAGTHSITAEYGGDTNFLGSSSSPLSETVTRATTTTTLTAAPNPSSATQAVTFTATVTSSTGGIAAGTVTFKDGNTVLGSSPLNAGGTAAFTTSSLSVASHTIKAVYAGTASYAGSTSANLKQVVNRAPTTTSLTSSPNPSGVGQMVTFTATVTGSSTPTGKVTFKDGGRNVGTVSLSAGQATFSTSSLKKGSHSITATYSGDSNFASSISPAQTQVVN